MQRRDVEKVLKLMGADYNSNYKRIAEKFIKYIAPREYLFNLTDELYDENKCLIAIKSILSTGKFDPNYKADFGYNFIQNAIYAGYSTSFIVDLINYCGSLRNKLNVNHQDEDGDTMLHTAIYADDFKGDVAEIYEALIEIGFNSKLVDNEHRSIVDAMTYEQRMHGKFHFSMLEKVRNMYEKQIGEKKQITNSLQLGPIDKVLERMGYDLNNNMNILKGELRPQEGGYLHYLTDDLHNELCCFAAIKSVIKAGYNPNELAIADYNFIQNALYSGYGTFFINGCIDAAMDPSLKQKLNINHRDDDGDTILLTAIYCNDECSVDVASIYKTLIKHGFDSKMKDKSGRTIVEAMQYEQNRCRKFSNSQIKEVEQLYNQALGIGDSSFPKSEQERHKRLDNEGLNNFLKNCRG